MCCEIHAKCRCFLIDLLGSFGFREDIMIWVRKKTGTPVVKLGSVDEATEFLKKYHSFVLGLFEKFEVCYLKWFSEFVDDSELICET